ncbi:MAG: DinB family protein [Bryobacteraceae bacterium]
MTIYEQLRFGDHIESAHQALQKISEEHSSGTFREGGWSRKEILGHLIDSALNNHQRFVRATLDGSYEGPGYAQVDWVNVHGYASMPWESILEHWAFQNRLLAEVVRRIPEARLEVSCRVGTDSPVTLRFLVEDYLAHMDHHLRQILSTS